MASRPSSTLTFRDALLLLCGVAGLVAWARYTGLACDAPADPDPAPLDTASDDTLADASSTLDLTSADTSPHDTLAPPNDLNDHHTDASTDLAEATAHSPVARCATVAIPERVERLCPVAEPPCPLEEAWLLSCEDAHALRMLAAPDGVVLATETRALPTFATQYEAFRFVPQQAAVRDGLWVTGRGVTNAWSLLPRPRRPDRAVAQDLPRPTAAALRGRRGARGRRARLLVACRGARRHQRRAPGLDGEGG